MTAAVAGLRAHRAAADQIGSVPVAVITVSDSRTKRTDASGRWLREVMEAAGHDAGVYALVRDEPAAINAAIDQALSTGARVVVLTGGTGIAARDITIEVVSERVEKELPGFGELFRMLSYKEIGAAAMLSRATAGTIGDSILIALPGAIAAVRLAWRELIEPEIGHIVALLDQSPPH